jgi:N-terminal acetyltransferase B complex non-catalytic subunit
VCKDNDTIKMFDDAYKKEPMNEDLAFQTFFSNARVGNWKAAQQVSPMLELCEVKLISSQGRSQDVQKFWARSILVLEHHERSASSASLCFICAQMLTVSQARDPATPANMRPILIQLAYRLMKSKDVHDICQNQDRFHLWLTILLEADFLEEAEALVNSDLGKIACDASLSCDELRRTVMQKCGKWEQEGKLARERIQERRSGGFFGSQNGDSDM